MFGQIPFAPVGAKWYIKANWECYGGQVTDDQYYVREVIADSIIQGKYCTLISTNDGPNCQNSYYVHQDGEKVYVLNEENGDFQLLYDFEAPVGATWKIAVCEWFYETDSMTITVKDVKPTYQKVDMTPDSTGSLWNFINFKIIKGVGGEYDNPLLFYTLEVFVPGCETKLLCYETPTTGLIAISGASCVDAVDEPASSFTVLLYPNPASETSTLHITSPLPAISKWELIDQLGRTVKHEILAASQQEREIELDKVGAGLYFWKLTVEEKSLATGKLFVLK